MNSDMQNIENQIKNLQKVRDLLQQRSDLEAEVSRLLSTAGANTPINVPEKASSSPPETVMYENGRPVRKKRECSRKGAHRGTKAGPGQGTLTNDVLVTINKLGPMPACEVPKSIPDLKSSSTHMLLHVLRDRGLVTVIGKTSRQITMTQQKVVPVYAITKAGKNYLIQTGQLSEQTQEKPNLEQAIKQAAQSFRFSPAIVRETYSFVTSTPQTTVDIADRCRKRRPRTTTNTVYRILQFLRGLNYVTGERMGRHSYWRI